MSDVAGAPPLANGALGASKLIGLQTADAGSDLLRGRLDVLDGWRAISILAVLFGHWLPLGPQAFQLNSAAPAAGMALFFTLSGFLIVRFLAAGTSIGQFLIRRAARILPLAWVAMIVLALWQPLDFMGVLRNVTFWSNLPPASLFHGGEHLWSLCVEVQFYVGIAIACLIFGRRGLYAIPVLCLAVTVARVVDQQTTSIVTWHRVDEILAGGTLAMAYIGMLGTRAQAIVARLPMWPLVFILFVCANPLSGPLQYLRPHAAALLVGSTLMNCPAWPKRLLSSRPLAYIAQISYALYVVHGVLSVSWLGSGEKLARYAKRPLLFAATFAIAHLSTRYFELPITRLARRIGRRAKPEPA